MRVTAAAFAIGGLALAGIPPFAGFWSKDDVLSAVYSQLGAHPLYWPFFLLAFAAVFLTAYYIFRAWFLAFSGDGPRDTTLPEAHEGPWVMQVPLVILSAFAVVAGLFVFLPGFQSLLLNGAGVAGIPPVYGSTDLLLSAGSVGLGLGGIGLAWSMWGNGRVYALSETSTLQPLRRLLLNRYYFKVGYDWIGQKGVYTVARAADFVDRFVIDGTVRGLERMFAAASNRLRSGQTGIVSDYAAYVIGGLLALFVLLLIVGPYLLSKFGGA
jgi:NADH-quinone oxidoreductase subunit L